MNILKTLFGSKPIEQLLNVVETVSTPKIPMSVQLVLMMEQLIQENRNSLSLSSSEEKFNILSAEYNRFKQIGMENTKNARIILEQIQSIRSVLEVRNKAEELFKFIKRIRSFFGENTILIGTTQFEELCKKYKLDIGLLNDYTGVIPEKNIKEIENVVSKVNSRVCPSEINKTFNQGYVFKVNEVKHDLVSISNLKVFDDFYKWVNRKKVIISKRLENYDGTIWLEDLKGMNPGLPESCENFKHDNLIKLDCTRVTNETIFIACPPEQLKEQSIKVTKMAIDPIVFQYSPYGVIVHSVWGEEAEDQVFEEYKKINNLLSL